MKYNGYIIPISFILALLLGYFFFTQGAKPELSYAEQIQQKRLKKEYWLKSAEDSPFAGVPSGFSPLGYFEPDESFKVSASLEFIDDLTKVTLPTTDGRLREYFRFAYLHFELGSQPQRLLVFKPVNSSSNSELFLGFRDETNGSETYAGGRYLDLEYSQGSELILDFNMAYNPFCVYAEDYSCPIPPAVNQLSVPIAAGEKMYRK